MSAEAHGAAALLSLGIISVQKNIEAQSASEVPLFNGPSEMRKVLQVLANSFDSLTMDKYVVIVESKAFYILYKTFEKVRVFL